MYPKAFTKAWREQIIRDHSTARLVRVNGKPQASEKVYMLPPDPITGIQETSRMLSDIDVMDRQVRRLCA